MNFHLHREWTSLSCVTQTIQSWDLALTYITYRWRSNLMSRKPTVNSLRNACEGRVETRNRNKDIFGILGVEPLGSITTFSWTQITSITCQSIFFIFLLWILFTLSVFTFFPVPSWELLYTTKHIWKKTTKYICPSEKKISDIWLSSCTWNTWLLLHFHVTILSPDIKWEEGWENSLLACSQGKM